MNTFKKSFFFLLLLSVNFGTFAQQYDLIVTIRGDSIACNIDSITSTSVYFEMKYEDVWINTHMDRKDVSEYEYDAIDGNMYVFKPGTSYIKSPSQTHPASNRFIRKNSVYAGILSINYARTIPVDQVGITIGGGFLWIDGPGFVIESTVLIGSNRHFFEPGIMGFSIFNTSTGEIADPYDSDDKLAGVTVRMGYRYQGTRGFLFRAGANLAFFVGGEVYVYPALSVGYSF